MAIRTVTHLNFRGDARAALEPAYGKRLCVARSQHSPAEIHRTQHHLETAMKPYGIEAPYEVGGGALDPGTEQAEVTASVGIVTDRFARLVDAQPHRLVRVKVWLVPFR